MAYNYIEDFSTREDLKKYDSNALLLYALELRYGLEDIESVAADALTDGSEDKKCDLIYIDDSDGIAIVAQGYVRKNPNPEDIAKANKASDLNTAVGWVFGRDLDDVPEIIRSSVASLRDAIKENKINTLYFWYVHNCEESDEVRDELKTVEGSLRRHLDAFVPNHNIIATALEIGNQTLERWYNNTENKILVTEEIEIPLVYGGFEIHESKWTAYQACIQGSQLYDMYQKHGDDLFSANPRRFLGAGRRTNAINMGIQDTASTSPKNFWVYNNGITALSHSFEILDAPEQKLKIRGISIINGAQTTGSLGSLKSRPSDDLYISMRVIVCNDGDTIESIIANNNKQNDMQPSDFRSNDVVQSRLRSQFGKNYSNIIYYSGGQRSDKRPRAVEVFDPGLVAQVLTAYDAVNPVDAYSNKKLIWSNDRLYSNVFNDDLSPEHIIFVYSLMKAIDEKKYSLALAKKGDSILDEDLSQLEFLSRRGSRILLLSTIAKNLEIITKQKINAQNKTRFTNNSNFAQCKLWWAPIVDIVLSFYTYMQNALSAGGLNSKERAERAIEETRSMLNAISSTIQPQIEDFKNNVAF